MATTRAIVGEYSNSSATSNGPTRIVSVIDGNRAYPAEVPEVAPTVITQNEEDQAPQVVGQVQTLWDKHPTLTKEDHVRHLEQQDIPIDRFDWESLGYPELIGKQNGNDHILDEFEPEKPKPEPEPESEVSNIPPDSVRQIGPDPDILLYSFNEGDLVNFVENYDKGGFIQYSDGGGENIGVVTTDTPGEENINVDWEYSEYNNPPPECLPRWYVEKSTDPAAIVKLFNKKLERQQNVIEDGATVQAAGYPGSIGKLDYSTGDWANVTWHPESKTFPPSYLENKLLQPISEGQLDIKVDLSELREAKDQLKSEFQRQQYDTQEKYSDLRQQTDADITTLRVEKEKLESKVVGLSEDREQLHAELNATRDFTASLSDQLSAVMKEIQVLKDAGKQEEVAEIERKEVLPVLAKMRKRDLAKSFIQTIGKTVGKEVLVRIAQMSGYDLNWVLKLIGIS